MWSIFLLGQLYVLQSENNVEAKFYFGIRLFVRNKKQIKQISFFYMGSEEAVFNHAVGVLAPVAAH